MTTSTNLYLAPNADFNLGSNTNVMVFGTPTGNSEVDLPSASVNANIVINANVDQIGFGGALSAYTFQAVGNTVNVYQAGTGNLVTSIDVDTASSGTLLSFGGAYGSSGFGTAASLSPLALKINPVGNSFDITLNGDVLSTATNGAAVTLPTTPSVSIGNINTTQASEGVNVPVNENSGGIGDAVTITVTDSAGHQVTESSTMASSGSGGSDHTFNLSPAQIATLSNGALEVGVSVTDSNSHVSQAINQAVTLAVTPTPPVFSSAAVSASTLVMSYTDLNPLGTETPAAGTFTVMDGSAADVVNNVVVNAAAKTVTLTLATPVAYGNAVTVAYAPPSSATAIQDGLYGGLAGSLSATSVTNNTPIPTPPILTGAAVNAGTLTLSFNDANALGAEKPATSAFTVMDGSNADNVTNVTVNQAAKTVTLALTTPIAYNDNGVTVAYAAPSSSTAIQDGTNGGQVASFSATHATNNTPPPPPVFASAAVNGATLTMTYTDSDSNLSQPLPASSAFTVKDGTTTDNVTNVQQTGSDTFALTLATAVGHGDAVTVAYAVPGSNPLKDGNAAAATSLSATSVTNNTPLTPTPPVFAGATVDGNQLVLSYTDGNPLATGTPILGAFEVEDTPQNHSSGLDAVTVIAVNANAKTVTLTLTSPVGGGDVVTFGYTAGINGGTSIQDSVNGGVAGSLNFPTSVTNLTPTPPVLSSAAVNGSTLTLSYTDGNNLGAETPAASAFTVKDGANTDAVTNVTVNQAAKTVTLALTSAVANGDTAVTVAYVAPGSNSIQDGTNGGMAANIPASTSVTNITPLPAPTAVTLLASGPTGDNVVSNTYNNTNTELTIGATIAAAVAGETADFYVGGVLVGTQTSITVGATTVSDTVDVQMIVGGAAHTALAAGGPVTVTVIDGSGNVSAASAAATLNNVSANPPAAPTAMAIAADGTGGYIVSGGAPTGETVSVTVSDSAGSPHSVTETSAAASGSAYSIDVTAADLSTLQNSTWHVSAVANAANGNVSAAEEQPVIIIESSSASSDSYISTGSGNASTTQTSYVNLASGFELDVTDSGHNGGAHQGNLIANLAAPGGNLTVGIDPNTSNNYEVLIDNLTVSNVAALTFNVIGTAGHVASLMGAMSNVTVTSSLYGGELYIDAIADTALTTIDASAIGITGLILGDGTPLPQNNLHVTIGSVTQPQEDGDTVDTSGSGSVVVIDDQFGYDQVATSGSGSHITIDDAYPMDERPDVGSTISATGANAVITVGDSTRGVGTNTIVASGNGAQVTFVGAQYFNATAAVGSNASVTFGSTDASDTETAIVTGDLAGVGITGTASSSNFAFTILNNVISGVGDLVAFGDSANEVLGASFGNGTLAATIAALNPTTALATALNDAVAAASTDLISIGGNVNGVLEWFEYNGNTYVVEANGTAHSMLSATDAVVEFSGSYDLSQATLNGGTLSGFMAVTSINETNNVSGTDIYSTAGSASGGSLMPETIYNNLASTFELDITNTSNTGTHLGGITANFASSGGSLAVFLDPANGGNAFVIDSLHVSNATTLTINNPGSGGASITSLISTDNALTTLYLTNANNAANPSAGSGSAIEIGGIAGASNALGHPFFTIDATATTSTVTLFDAAPITQNSVNITGGTAQMIIGNWSNSSSPTDGMQGGGGLVALGGVSLGDNNANNFVYSTGNNFVGIDGDGNNTINVGPGTGVIIGLDPEDQNTQDQSGHIGANVITEVGNGAYIKLSGIQNQDSAITVGQNATVNYGTTDASDTETVVVTGNVTYDTTTNYNHVGNSSDFASTTLYNVVTGTGDQVTFNNSTNEVLDTVNNATLAATVSGMSLTHALDAAVAQAQNTLTAANSTTTTGVIEWFVNNGNTYVVEANYTQGEATTPSNAHAALSASDAVVELVGVTSISPVLNGHTVTL